MHEQTGKYGMEKALCSTTRLVRYSSMYTTRSDLCTTITSFTTASWTLNKSALRNKRLNCWFIKILHIFEKNNLSTCNNVASSVRNVEFQGTLFNKGYSYLELGISVRWTRYMIETHRWVFWCSSLRNAVVGGARPSQSATRWLTQSSSSLFLLSKMAE